MKPARNNQRDRKAQLATMEVDELWLDQSITPRELIQLDPLDITAEMIAQAERPELANATLQQLPR